MIIVSVWYLQNVFKCIQIVLKSVRAGGVERKMI